MRRIDLAMKSNAAVNSNEVYGKVTLQQTPIRFVGKTRLKNRYGKDSVRGSQKQILLRSGKRYIE